VSETSPPSGVAGRYATALFDLAVESDAVDSVESQVRLLGDALRASADLRSVIASPIHSRDEQARAMAAVCAALGVGAPASNLVALMAAKRRLGALPAVILGFDALLAKKRGVISAEVRSAAPLSAAQRENLERTLREATGAQIALDAIVDEALIGGLVVKVGSRMIDTSIRSQLAKLQTIMKEARI